MIDCIGWMIGVRFVCLISWFVVMVGRLVGLLMVVWLVSFTFWLVVGWLVGWLVFRLVGWLMVGLCFVWLIG